jgi:hypothetical protein
MALIQLGNFRHSTPGAGLEIIFNVPPLHLALARRAMGELLQVRGLVDAGTKCRNKNNPYGLPHRQFCEELMAKWGFDENMNTDPKIDERSVTNKFLISKGSYDGEMDRHRAGIRIFVSTYTTNGFTGCGVYIMDGHEVIRSEAFHTGKADRLQAELLAIKNAAQWISNQGRRSTCTLLTHSSAALNALGQTHITSELLSETIDCLNWASEQAPLRVQWCQPKTVNHTQKEIRKLAREGAGNPALDSIMPAGLTKTQVKHHIRDLLEAQWKKEWWATIEYRQVKHWYAKADKSKAKDLLKYNRYRISGFVQHMTGHNFLRKHQALVDGFDRDQNPEEFSCHQCMEGDEYQESSIHITTECPAFCTPRALYLGGALIDANPNEEPCELWTVQQMVSFIEATELYDMQGGDINGNVVNPKLDAKRKEH